MKHTRLLTLFSIILLLLITGCSQDNDNVSETATAQPTEAEEETTADNDSNGSENAEESNDLYHEIGEPFVMTTYYSDADAEVTVNKVWTEPAQDHSEFVEQRVSSPDENTNVTFIDYTVTNLSDEEIGLPDLLPEYTAANTEVDVSYPENDQFADEFESFDYALEPNETLDLVGAVVTEKNDEYTSAFLWNITQDIPEVVFFTPQSEQESKIGIYEMGEPIYLLDYEDNGSLQVTIDDVSIEENPDLEQGNVDLSDMSALVLDITIENTIDEIQTIEQALPKPVVDGEAVIHTFNVNIDGNWIDLYDLEGKLEKGDSITGKAYISVEKDKIDDVQLYYFHPELLLFPDYSKVLNYNI
ncbi:hypothetical protein [Oceanobacillus alkalisoli]|uniref:hypothetical protein n=1 Tax=Oceanobacillus alkalisoli TaxID=2925113 RepID=UPI001F11B374|nr:hypothetical protein [Oceanobacillus alkalisoli]MCF3943050.1 hypothetical protein [Oceanobacillus alkalisoli]